LRRADRDPNTVIGQARAAFAGEHNPRVGWEEAPAPSVRLIGAVLAMRSASRAAVEERLRAVMSSEALRLSAHIGVVGTIGNIAPFIGLFGTVLGIIRAFRDIGEAGAAGPAVVATGISEALVATAAGLFVAITAVIVYNLFVTWKARLMRRADIVAAEVLNMVAPEG